MMVTWNECPSPVMTCMMGMLDMEEKKGMCLDEYMWSWIKLREIDIDMATIKLHSTGSRCSRMR